VVVACVTHPLTWYGPRQIIIAHAEHRLKQSGKLGGMVLTFYSWTCSDYCLAVNAVKLISCACVELSIADADALAACKGRWRLTLLAKADGG
jgi:hypothetical protein